MASTLLRSGVRIARVYDLGLAARILGAFAPSSPERYPERERLGMLPLERERGLFELDAAAEHADPAAEYLRQAELIAASQAPSRLRLLTSAESVGALVSSEIHHAGLPWSREGHERLLEQTLGPRPVAGGRPARLEEQLALVRRLLDAPELDPESPGQLLRALQHAGLTATSTRAWELREFEHPAIGPLLEYKRMQRLRVANGWSWLDEWVADGRFRPRFVVGGVVTGRWASEGGGALQLPRQVRGAVVADPGWKLVVADAAQLEPRVLAAMSGDRAMAAAGQAHDLYEGMVASGVVPDRRAAKYGMLGAIYGGTTGLSGQVLPRIRRAFPDAMGFVEAAALAGERGERVRTWLGRVSPGGPSAEFDETLSNTELRRRGSAARERGRFTRNYVVQGTAAEWALCWMGALRAALWELGEAGQPGLAPAPFGRRPHLVFFLHDELVVHTPQKLAEPVAEAMRSTARDAGVMLFGTTPVEWSLSVAVVDSYDQAK